MLSLSSHLRQSRTAIVRTALRRRHVNNNCSNNTAAAATTTSIIGKSSWNDCGGTDIGYNYNSNSHHHRWSSRSSSLLSSSASVMSSNNQEEDDTNNRHTNFTTLEIPSLSSSLSSSSSHSNLNVTYDEEQSMTNEQIYKKLNESINFPFLISSK